MARATAAGLFSAKELIKLAEKAYKFWKERKAEKEQAKAIENNGKDFQYVYEHIAKVIKPQLDADNPAAIAAIRGLIAFNLGKIAKELAERRKVLGDSLYSEAKGQYESINKELEKELQALQTRLKAKKDEASASATSAVRPRG